MESSYLLLHPSKIALHLHKPERKPLGSSSDRHNWMDNLSVDSMDYLAFHQPYLVIKHVKGIQGCCYDAAVPWHCSQLYLSSQFIWEIQNPSVQ